MADIDTSTQGLWWLQPQNWTETSQNLIPSMLDRASRNQQQKRDNVMKMLEFNLREKEANVRMQSDIINQKEYHDYLEDVPKLNALMAKPDQAMPTDFKSAKGIQQAETIRRNSAWSKAREDGLRDLQEQQTFIFKNAPQSIPEFDSVKLGSPQWGQLISKWQPIAQEKELSRQKELAQAKGTGIPIAVKYEKWADAYAEQAEEARAAGKVEEYQQLKAKSEEMRARAAPRTMGVTATVDEHGNPVSSITFGPRAGPTVRTATMVQEKAISYETAISAINDVMTKIRPTDVGISGVAGENIFDKWLSSVSEATGGPAVGDNQRIQNRQALRNLRELLFQSFSPERMSGTGFSNKDVARLRELADSLEASKGYAYFQNTMTEIKNLISDRARIQAQATGQPIPDAVKTPDEIITGYNSFRAQMQKDVSENRRTREEVNRILGIAHQRAKDSLKKFHSIDLP